jgi:hypothetical protein
MPVLQGPFLSDVILVSRHQPLILKNSESASSSMSEFNSSVFLGRVMAFPKLSQINFFRFWKYSKQSCSKKIQKKRLGGHFLNFGFKSPNRPFLPRWTQIFSRKRSKTFLSGSKWSNKWWKWPIFSLNFVCTWQKFWRKSRCSELIRIY